MTKVTHVPYTRYAPPPEINYPPEELVIDEDTSVVCTDCLTLVDGVHDGERVLWVLCDECVSKRKIVPPVSVTYNQVMSAVIGLMVFAIIVRFCVVYFNQ